jgi:hypothetical protein
MTPAEMNEHVRSLCAQNEIIVSECRRASQALALRECSEVTTPPVRSVKGHLRAATPLVDVAAVPGA